MTSAWTGSEWTDAKVENKFGEYCRKLSSPVVTVALAQRTACGELMHLNAVLKDLHVRCGQRVNIVQRVGGQHEEVCGQSWR